jgi:Fic family protein
MFIPKYSLSGKLLNNVAQIERLYGQLEALKLPQKLELNLKRDNLIQSTYASNKIEGNPLSLPEVTNLLLDDRVPVNRDEKEVTFYFNLLQELNNYVAQPLEIRLVTEIHGELFKTIHEYAGTIRNEIVAVGKYTKEADKVKFNVKHLPPFHAESEIVSAITELLIWVNQQKELPIALKAGIFHHQFLFIHPFEDGNGRVCRSLTALIFMQAGYQINKYFILDDYYDLDRTEYSDALHSADEGELTHWLEYFSDGVKYSLQSALGKAQQAIRTLAIAERPTNKEQEVLTMLTQQTEMTSMEVVNKLKVSRQQAHNLLSGLVDKGLVERHGTTKSSYYTLK